MNKSFAEEIRGAVETIVNGPNGNVSEPHHLRGFDACSEFTRGRATRRFVDANMDMLVHHFIKETTAIGGLNVLTDAQHERQEHLTELLSEFLLTVREQILEDKL